MVLQSIGVELLKSKFLDFIMALLSTFLKLEIGWKIKNLLKGIYYIFDNFSSVCELYKSSHFTHLTFNIFIFSFNFSCLPEEEKAFIRENILIFNESIPEVKFYFQISHHRNLSSKSIWFWALCFGDKSGFLVNKLQLLLIFYFSACTTSCCYNW